ncbi:MAG: hypothetical protein IJX98_04215 [Clostridia bacterium]|nr:hypothetical protein [Clostridia bacterium]
MQKKKIVTVILTAILFLSAALIGVANVYRVDSVVLNAGTVSSAARAEAEALKKELEEAYAGESSIFAGETVAKEIFEKYPYFRMSGFERAFPNQLVIEATEEEEVFAVAQGENYFVLAGDGTVLGVRSDSANRVDGSANILVSGLSASGAEGEKVRGEHTAELIEICRVMATSLNGVRSNVKEIKLIPEGTGPRLIFYMREGVKISVKNPSVLTAEKASALTEKYLSLSVEQRLTGGIQVIESPDQTKVLLDYSPNYLLGV